VPGIQFRQQIDMNALKVTEMAPGTAGTDAVNLDQLNAVAPTGFATDLGDGVASSFTVSHGLETVDVVIQVYENATGEEVLAQVSRLGADDMNITFGFVPSVNQFRVLVIPVPS
jgi:autotransporter adhesin